MYADILGVANVAWVAGDRLQGSKYTIERELGRGRFGITYLVKNKNGDRRDRSLTLRHCCFDSYFKTISVS
jgi:hypothetical protein